MVSFRTATDIADMEQIIDLEIGIWGVSERDAFPPHLLMLPQHHGGVVLVAEDVDEIIGFCVGIPAKRHGEWCLWSYIAGVHPNHQGTGVGEALKRRQREWATEQGYGSVHWTFDPLQARNANFNLNRLGVVVRTYHENIYGIMQDAINSAGMPSDRLETVWFTGEHDAAETSQPPHDSVRFLVQNEGNKPVLDLGKATQGEVGIVLPHTRDESL
ncbi:MAG: GNAT family N-acetyltransferase, partial [Chloroflexota bacterium]